MVVPSTHSNVAAIHPSKANLLSQTCHQSWQVLAPKEGAIIVALLQQLSEALHWLNEDLKLTMNTSGVSSGRTGQGKVQVQVLLGDHPEVVYHKLPVGVVLNIINAQRLTENQYGHFAALICQDLKEPWFVWNVGEALHDAHCLLHQGQDLRTHARTTLVGASAMQQVCCLTSGDCSSAQTRLKQRLPFSSCQLQYLMQKSSCAVAATANVICGLPARHLRQ